MKSLAISLACALGLSTPGICGDLGSADIGTRNDLKAEFSFSANCYGPLDKPKGPECAVNFVDGKMNVDGSEGILPSQIISIEDGWYPNGYYVAIQYITTQGDTSLGQFTFYEKHVAKQFLNAVISFKSNNSTPKSEVINEVIEPDSSNTDNEILDYSNCTGPTILCMDAEIKEQNISDDSEIIEETVEQQPEVDTFDTNDFSPVVPVESDECTGPTILCF